MLQQYELDIEEAIKDALDYLDRDRLNSLKDKPYSLAIVTYALTVAESTLASEALEMLEAMKTEESE